MNHSTKTDIDGLHQTVYWVKKNPKYLEEKKMGSVKQSTSRYSTCTTYVGEWKNGKKCGFGTMERKNDSKYKYEGQWKDNMREGSGTLWTKNRTGHMVKRYSGGWSRDMFHGEGVLYLDKGGKYEEGKYEGSFRNHKRHGRGTMEYANGNIYEGQWENGKKSGIGVLLYANGDRFEGCFRDDLKEGPGRHYYVKSRKIYDGEWLDDMAKCGVYSDMPEEFDCEPSKEDSYTIKLPSLELKDSVGVLNKAIQEVEDKRENGCY